MNRTINYALILLIIAITAGCTKPPAKEDQIVAQINDYQLTVADFMHDAKLNLPTEFIKDNLEPIKEQLCDDIIINELILQEAEKIGLDKDKAFMDEIEYYWKQSLIKRIINLKGAEAIAQVMKTNYVLSALDSYNGTDKEQIKEKAQALVNLWIENLKKTAKIHKNSDLLKKIDLSTIKTDEGGIYGK
ncbi:MAG: hypothetical protein PHU59_02220 [Candidatus Omnitrophica bacterium]|nr:hypothetical protein [Candidatus Omnitrophota bacterium]